MWICFGLELPYESLRFFGLSGSISTTRTELFASVAADAFEIIRASGGVFFPLDTSIAKHIERCWAKKYGESKPLQNCLSPLGNIKTFFLLFVKIESFYFMSEVGIASKRCYPSSKCYSFYGKQPIQMEKATEEEIKRDLLRTVNTHYVHVWEKTYLTNIYSWYWIDFDFVFVGFSHRFFFSSIQIILAMFMIFTTIFVLI